MKVVTKGHKTRRKLKKRLTLVGLQKEIDALRTVIIGLVHDDEGEYRPEFVKEILNRPKEKTLYTYSGPGSLLKLLKKV